MDAVLIVGSGSLYLTCAGSDAVEWMMAVLVMADQVRSRIAHTTKRNILTDIYYLAALVDSAKGALRVRPG